jgi:catechol 2,3-dioxygenase
MNFDQEGASMNSLDIDGADPPYGLAPPGYRLPESLRLGRVVLRVAELERSLAYYRRVLGMEVLDRSDAASTLAPRGDRQALVELRERKGAAPVPMRGRPGLYHFAILLPDRAALGRFAAHLADIDVRTGASDHLVSEALYLQDPDGLGIEVYADRPASLWRHRRRELVMATEPLDLRELTAAAGGEPWTGMPSGARIGHVHLHVGDLQRAADFYHRGLGFDQVVWSYPGALFLSAGGYHHHLGVNTWAAASPPATEADAGLVEWRMVLPEVGEVQAAARSLEECGYPPERAGDGEVLARDPWGTAVRLTTRDRAAVVHEDA